MSKVLWHVTMSLDGFITGAGGDMSWMADYVGPNPTVTEVLERIGAVFIGHRTFRGDTTNPGASTDSGRAYGGAVDVPHFVFTREVPDPPEPGFTFVTDLESGIAAARAAAGERYVAILGAATARQCLEAGRLDEILIHLVPILLGDGVRLFDRPGQPPVPLERIDLTGPPAVTNLWFRVPH